MKMPKKIGEDMLAPCGMNCMICYRHCAHPKPCGGCLAGDANKPEHCRKCKIRSCALEKGMAGCRDCPEAPCKPLDALEKTYRARYGISLLQNGRIAREEGICALMERERIRYSCTACGGVISLHDAKCGECGGFDKL